MKSTVKYLIWILLVAALAACTPTIYGVPQDRWDLMTEQERIVAMEAYKEHQIAYQKAAAERARLRAEQEAARRASLELEMERRRARVEHIYSGHGANFGDLIEVTLYGGQIRLNGKKQGYQPITFKIADGEVKSIPIHYSKGRSGELYILYENRHLWIDTDPFGKNTRSAHLIFDNSWGDGRTYAGINSHGSRDLRLVNLDIAVTPTGKDYRPHRQQPKVIVKEKVVQAPPKVIIKEKTVHTPPQKVVKEQKKSTSSQDWRDEKRTDHPKISSPETNPENPDRSKRPSNELRDVASKSSDNSLNHKNTNKAAVGRVTVVLNGGKVMIDGRHRPFKPVKFSISEGETKTVEVRGGQNAGKNNDFSAGLVVCSIDPLGHIDGSATDNGAGVIKANRGNNTSVVSTRGALELQGVGVKISSL